LRFNRNITGRKKIPHDKKYENVEQMFFIERIIFEKNNFENGNIFVREIISGCTTISKAVH